MANGYFERGEMYDILFGDALAGEMAAHRPGVIVSSDEGNRTSPSVLMVYTTTTTANKRISVNHPFQMNGWDNYALCSQIVTVNKNRLKKFYGKLSDSDMRAIDGCLEEALDLGYIDDTAVKEKEAEIAVRDVQIKELKAEIAKLQAEIDKRADDDMAVKVEIAMWQRLYEKALDQVCSMKLTGDITRRAERAPVAPVKPAPIVEPKNPEPPVEDEPKLVDINTAKFDELRKCGFSSNIAVTIINRRPYSSVEDLKNVPGINSMMYGILSKKVCCVAQPKPKRIVSALVEPDQGYEVEKVNINTATAKEITEKLGFGSQYYGHKIVKYRNENGSYVDLEELRDVKDLPKNFLDRYRDHITIGEDEPSQKQTSAGKVNVNTAKAAEIKELLGCSLNAAYAITAYRRTNGSISRLEEIASLQYWSESMLAKYRDKLEV